MLGKKGIGLGTVVVLLFIAIFLYIYLTYGINLFKPILKAFGYVLSLFSISIVKTPEISAGTPNAPTELNQAYNELISFFKNTKYNEECLIRAIQFPEDFKGYSIILEKSFQKQYDGLYIVINDPKGEIKREFVERKYPCIVIGQTQVQYFINKFITQKGSIIGNSIDNQKYERAKKISIKGKNQIIVEYESGKPSDNAVLDDSNLMFNIDQNNICFLPTYSFLGFSSYDRGIPPTYVRDLALDKQQNFCK